MRICNLLSINRVGSIDKMAGRLPCLLLVLFITFLPGFAVSNESQSPDTLGNVGRFTSLVLDSKGNPIVSYQDLTNRDLKLLRCDDPNCDGNESRNISIPDSEGMVGTYSSLALDEQDRPIVSYYESSLGVLKLLHCNSADCASASKFILDSSDVVGSYSSLVLDENGNPVVSYYDNSNGNLKLLHCGDARCMVIKNRHISTPDEVGDVGLYTSLALDKAGNPVISYYASDSGLKLLHCDDANCEGNESGNISTPVKGDVGWYSSLALDGEGNPVISYYDLTSGQLKVLHCDDPKCVGDESQNITTPDTASNAGAYLSMVLDTRGNPVISYHDSKNSDLKILHCDDPGCAGDESGNITRLAAEGDAGLYTSLALDTKGNPVVSYYDFSNGDLKVLHCENHNCKEKRN